MKHAPFSPSSLKSRSVCPRWQPEENEHEHELTTAGSRIHEAAEHEDLSLCADDEEREYAQWCLDQTSDIQGEIHREIMLDTSIPDCWGTADFVAVQRSAVILRDYKTGYNPVDRPTENYQATAYALGAFRKWPQADRVEFAFLYPRLGRVDRGVFLRSSMEEMEADLRRVIDACKSNAAAQPAPANCLYCGFKTKCAAWAKVASDIAEHDDLLPSPLVPAEISDPSQLARALDIAPVLERWARQVREFALSRRLEDGVEIPGYEVAHRRARQKVADPKAIYALARESGLDEDDFVAACEISVPKLAKAASALAERGKKGVVERAFRREAADSGAAPEPGEYPYLRKSKP